MSAIPAHWSGPWWMSPAFGRPTSLWCAGEELVCDRLEIDLRQQPGSLWIDWRGVLSQSPLRYVWDAARTRQPVALDLLIEQPLWVLRFDAYVGDVEGWPQDHDGTNRMRFGIYPTSGASPYGKLWDYCAPIHARWERRQAAKQATRKPRKRRATAVKE